MKLPEGIKPQFTVADLAASTLNENAEALKREAQAKGINLRIKTTVQEDDSSWQWFGVLLSILLERPATSKESNETLLRLVSERLALDRGLHVSRMSQKLSAQRRDMAERMLLDAGYAATGIKTASDVKRRIRAGKKRNEGITSTITTAFQADGIVIDGYLRKYRKRDITPIGQPWMTTRFDFATRTYRLAQCSRCAASALRNSRQPMSRQWQGQRPNSGDFERRLRGKA